MLFTEVDSISPERRLRIIPRLKGWEPEVRLKLVQLGSVPTAESLKNKY